jgi:Mg2+ and Co2+ transporter CorA
MSNTLIHELLIIFLSGVLKTFFIQKENYRRKLTNAHVRKFVTLEFVVFETGLDTVRQKEPVPSTGRAVGRLLCLQCQSSSSGSNWVRSFPLLHLMPETNVVSETL